MVRSQFNIRAAIAMAACVLFGRVIAFGYTSEPAPRSSTTAATNTDAYALDTEHYAPDTEQNDQESLLNQVGQKVLPSAVSEQLDLNLYGWFDYQRSSLEEYNSNWNGDIALDVNKGFGDRLAVEADMHFKQYNSESRGDLEQIYATWLAAPDAGTELTLGKFSPGIGLERRDFWDRFGGTTSLLFGAQPQDTTGIMVTQPIGKTGVTVQPFIVANFQRNVDLNIPPSFGAIVQYQPSSQLTLKLTGWSGPGFRESDDGADEEDDDEALEYSSDVTNNWDGPDFDAERGGQLLFVDANAMWQPRNDLTLGMEYLVGTTGSSEGRDGWAGMMVLCNYDLNDRWHIFGRWSYLNDYNGLVTGIEQRRHELSAGIGTRLTPQLELRGEYRHDFSNNAPNMDSVSIHLSFHL